MRVVRHGLEPEAGGVEGHCQGLDEVHDQTLARDQDGVGRVDGADGVERGGDGGVVEVREGAHVRAAGRRALPQRVVRVLVEQDVAVAVQQRADRAVPGGPAGREQDHVLDVQRLAELGLERRGQRSTAVEGRLPGGDRPVVA